MVTILAGLFALTTAWGMPSVEPTVRASITSYEAAVSGLPSAHRLERPKWIRHRVAPREQISQIAARYGVRARDVRRWNDLPSSTAELRTGTKLRIHARRWAAPRARIDYQPTKTERWSDIAAKFRVGGTDLRAWNWQQREPSPERKVVVWVDPGLDPLPRTESPSEIADVPRVSGDARSRGYPDQGRIKGHAMLPESTLYTRGPGYVMWGSSYALTALVEAMARFRAATHYDGEIHIGAISRKGGGRLPPHQSHQSGRDVDIRLPLLPYVPPTHRPNPDEIDWLTTWILIKGVADGGRATRVFLDVSLHRRLYEAARVLGETTESLQAVIAWPSWAPGTDPLVRHSAGHEHHIHVRFACGPRERRCRKAKGHS